MVKASSIIVTLTVKVTVHDIKIRLRVKVTGPVVTMVN